MSARPPQPDELFFASRTISEHLLRGAIGIGAFALALVWATTYPWLLLVALPVGLVALRGCPMCWTLGLVLTVAARLRGRSIEQTCARGCDRTGSGPK